MGSPIVLLTDFGLRDHYVGTLKGVILSLHPAAVMVDLSHGVEAQNIVQAALYLEISYSFFPKGSIFVCVVDPGVGTTRAILCAKTSDYFFLGPDNGLLTLALAHERKVVIRSVKNRKFYFQKNPSATFQGRDIMTPAAARLAKNPKVFKTLGPAVSKIHKLELPPLRKTRKEISGEIVFFDHFGNAISNIRTADAGPFFWKGAEVWVKDIPLGKLRSTYGLGPETLTALFNSSSQLEIAMPNGSAQQEGSLEVGDPVKVRITA